MPFSCWRISDYLADGVLCVVYIALNVSLSSAHRLALQRLGFSFPAILTSAHMLLDLALLAPVMLLTPSYRREHARLWSGHWEQLCAVAVFNVTQDTFSSGSLIRVGFSVDQVMRTMLPVLVAAFQSVWNGPPPFHHAAAVIAVSLGASLAVLEPSAFSECHLQGVLLIMFGTALQASLMCFAGSLLSASFDALQVTFYTSPIALLVSIGPAALLEGHQFGHFVAAKPWLAFIALAGTSSLAAMCTVVGFQTVHRLGPVGSAVLGNVKTVVLVVLSSFLMGEVFSCSAVQLVGCALTLVGVVVHSLFKLSSVGKGLRGGGSWRAIWSSHSAFHIVAASMGLPVIAVFAFAVVLSEWHVLGPSGMLDFDASPRSSVAQRRVPTVADVDPCGNITIGAGQGQPSAATNELMLVTGGSGFIGSHLVAHLLDLGYSVRVFDNLETGNLLFLDLRAPLLEFHFGDILDVEALRAAMVGVRGVFHLGAASKVLPSLRDPSMATFNYERNAVGTSRVLQVANETSSVRKIVYAASSTYYGNQPVPHTETQPFAPTSPYAASKYMGELEMLTHDGLYHLPTLSLRFFMVYGPRNPSHGPYAVVTGKFLARLQTGHPLIIEGSGENFRDFVHVEDVARALILGYQSDVHGTVINIGSGKAYSVQEVADIVSSHQEHVAARPNDLLGTLADTCRAKRLLRFQARYDFLQTMHAMMADMTAGSAEYLAPMWEDLDVIRVLEQRLPGWSSPASSRERSAMIRRALDEDRSFLTGLLAEIRARP